AARIARDALARPLPAVQEARLRCVLAWVLCTSGLAQDASAEAGLVLARLPQLPGDLRDQATIAQLQALAGMPAEPQADRLAGTVLAAARDHGDPVIAAAHITRALMSWDKGRISQALESLVDAARGGTEVSADGRHAPPLPAAAGAGGRTGGPAPDRPGRRHPRGAWARQAARHRVRGGPSDPSRADTPGRGPAGRRGRRSRGRPGHRPDASGPRVCLG